jgi:hypothetical protein
MNILLNLNAKVGREGFFKPTIGNEMLHGISDENGVSVVTFGTSKNLSQMYNVQMYIATLNILRHLIERQSN